MEIYSLKPTPTKGECAGCVDCCVILKLTVPNEAGDRISKPAGVCCQWITATEGTLGCALFGKARRPWVCRQFKCSTIIKELSLGVGRGGV